MNARSKLALGIGVLAAAVAVAMGAARKIGVKSYGRPVGRVVRAGEQLAVLMETCDPYMPSLQGRDERDMSYSYALWLIPESGAGDMRVIRAAKSVRSGDRAHVAGVLGRVGDTVWLRIADLHGFDLVSGQRVATTPPASIANLTMSDYLGPHHEPALEPYRTTAVSLPSGGWLVLADEEEAPSELKPGTRLYHNATSKGTYRSRALFDVAAEPGPIARLATSTHLAGVEFKNGAFLRASENGEVIRFANPDGLLVVFDSSDSGPHTFHFARVNADGTVAWTVDSRMGRFTEILAHERWYTFVGELEDKLSQPMLAVLDLETGTIRQHSLQRPIQ